MRLNVGVTTSCYNLFYFFSNISRVVLYYEMKKKHTFQSPFIKLSYRLAKFCWEKTIFYLSKGSYRFMRAVKMYRVVRPSLDAQDACARFQSSKMRLYFRTKSIFLLTEHKVISIGEYCGHESMDQVECFKVRAFGFCLNSDWANREARKRKTKAIAKLLSTRY